MWKKRIVSWALKVTLAVGFVGTVEWICVQAGMWWLLPAVAATVLTILVLLTLTLDWMQIEN